VSKRNINECLSYFNIDLITKEVLKKCGPVYPLQNIVIRKVKTIKRPKIDGNE
jgi:small subunit ribosomal protein S3Ae